MSIHSTRSHPSSPWLRAAALFASLVVSAAAPAGQSAPETLTPMGDKPPAPPFTLPDGEGGELSLADLEGKVVVLNFWATWCPPCRKEMPSMQALWETLRGDSFELLAVNVGEDDDQVFAFRYSFEPPLEFPIVIDADSEVTGRYPVTGLPTTFVVDKQGRLVYRAVGEREWQADGIIDLIRQLMDESHGSQRAAR